VCNRKVCEVVGGWVGAAMDRAYCFRSTALRDALGVQVAGILASGSHPRTIRRGRKSIANDMGARM